MTEMSVTGTAAGSPAITIFPLTLARLSSKNFVNTALVGCDGNTICTACAVTSAVVDWRSSRLVSSAATREACR